ncbi:hypothetical protein ACFOW6_13895 [Fodinicurvata halophila]|uniref:Uncharacterized protein n=1 Tax=Fodinicurvata halophila TaxID=1419723 RepID=A0ABV8UN92_9PROT
MSAPSLRLTSDNATGWRWRDHRVPDGYGISASGLNCPRDIKDG